MLTVFTAPKPFVGPIERLQNNAVSSWLALRPKAQIILVGDEPGTDRAAARLGVEHAPAVERNEHGTPLVSDVFRQAESLARHPLLCYVNADIILLQDFVEGVKSVQAAFDRFLIVGRRWDADVEREYTPEEFADPELGRRLLEAATPHPPGGSDYFVFRKGEFSEMPRFAMGRAGWDNWMIYAGRSKGVPVVDASADVRILHQNHDYAHLPDGQPHYRLPESAANVELAGGREVMFRLPDADWRLEAGEVVAPAWPSPDLPRWVETGLIRRLGPGRAARLVRMALHPSDTLRYYGRKLRAALRPGEQPFPGSGRGGAWYNPPPRTGAIPMKYQYEETIEDLQTRIDIHDRYGGRDIDEWMLEVLELRKGMNILDVGCGSGKQLIAFHKALDGEVELTGGDVNQELLDQARERAAAEGVEAEILYLDFDKRFPMDDEIYDLVSCCFAIYYADDVAHTVSELHRVLKPGGRLFTTGPMPENKQFFYEVIREATGKSIPPMPGSSRYDSEILDAIKATFADVQFHIFENPLRFPVPDPFIEYTRASLSEDRKLWSGFFDDKEDFNRIMENIRRVAEGRQERDGELVMTKVVGGFLATK